MKRFKWNFTLIYENTVINFEDGGTCADAFLYNNTGSAPALIGGAIELQPGQTLALGAFGQEIQMGVHTIEFTGGSGSLVLAKKQYL